MELLIIIKAKWNFIKMNNNQLSICIPSNRNFIKSKDSISSAIDSEATMLI